MSATDNFMPFYIGAYLRDTKRLATSAQHGAYILLLLYYWTNGPLADDDEELAIIASCDPKTWAQIGPGIRRFFTKNGDGRLHQKRMDHELDRAADIRAKRKEAGRLAHANPPKLGISSANAQQMPSNCSANGPANDQQTGSKCRAIAEQTDQQKSAFAQQTERLLLVPSVSKNLSLIREVCAREGSEPISGEVMADPAAARAEWRGVVKAFTAVPPPYTPSVVFQLSALQPGRVKREPVDPIRTVEEQLAIVRRHGAA